MLGDFDIDLRLERKKQGYMLLERRIYKYLHNTVAWGSQLYVTKHQLTHHFCSCDFAISTSDVRKLRVYVIK